MTFPAIMDSTQTPWAGLAALGAGIFAAWRGRSLFQVAVFCCVTVFALELLLL